MMKRNLLFLVLFSLAAVAYADEGMWLPQLLKALNEKDMRKKGLKLKAKDIYSINKSSLKDAIVSLGGFCTAEVISGQGLLLTNHHCGFDAIQNHTTLEHNYLRDGFWAAGFTDELTNPGLTATFIIRIDDVTGGMLEGVTDAMSEKERALAIEKNMAAIKKNYKRESYQDILIRSFFEGNRYYLFVTETYRDVRLVGAPPSSIGNFGKDTDNWMWPRHTGDFSLFRIYAGKDNKPADYSPDNVPYVPRRSLKIATGGMKEGDFTMVFGFPGRTMEYLPEPAVNQIMTVNDPARIAIRAKVLTILDGYMRQDESIKIKYAAKYASIQNAYKKWQGEVLGLSTRNAIGRKQAYEQQFTAAIEASPALKTKYGDILAQLQSSYAEYEPLSLARDYYSETMPRIELFTIASIVNSYITASAKAGADIPKLKKETLDKCRELLKEYDAGVDKKIFEELMQHYFNNQPGLVTDEMKKQMEKAGSISALGEIIYRGTGLNEEMSLTALLEMPLPVLEKDPGLVFYREMNAAYATGPAAKISSLQGRISGLQRKYMAAQMEAFPKKKFYPDANGTLRITYGNVKGYKPRDGVSYGYYTYLDGVMEKYKPGDYEFDVPARLIDLYNKKDFGRWGVDGRQPVCFIGANHTTGGNSGSPALDARGNLVGLNFDRVWEGTMSDINYDVEICRNVMVDIRYVMFIIDKFAGASRLISEMEFTGTASR